MSLTARGSSGVVAAMLLLAGCTVTPDPIPEEQVSAQARSDLDSLFAPQDPIAAPITLQEATRRALTYNLDHRVQLMEEALARGQLEVARLEMLPEVAASAGYVTRSNKSGAASQSLLTGQPSLVPSTSQEQDRGLWSTGVVWNVLDFGVSYAQAKQSADEVLISGERRRRVVQAIMQDVRSAWWRAVVAQAMLEPMDALLADTRAALKAARAVESQTGPARSLAYQKELLETIRELWRVRRELTLAKTELATLMNVRPGTPFDLPDVGTLDMAIPAIAQSMESMEVDALTRRPELRESLYQKRIDRLEVRKAMLRMLPGLEFSTRIEYDSNDFLFNNRWAEMGLRVSWNVMSLFSGNAAKKVAEIRVEVTEARRMALAMAVLAQVHLSMQRYAVATENFRIADQLSNVDQRIERQVEAERAAAMEDQLELIRVRADALVGRMRRGLAYAEVQTAFGHVQSAVGRDPGAPS